ncbi:MAG: sigma-70 family RNA polymerase sigma factor [Acidobacteria bacterium]|nr:sigma-70 family RNA polymerase sigma factor [Acidobacteriota bacterium]
MGQDVASERLIELMEAYQQGSADAFDQIFGALAVPLRNYLTSLTRDRARGEDLMQETFLQMHRSRRTYMPGRPVKPWAFGIARNVYLMHRRSTARRAKYEAGTFEELPETPTLGLAELLPDRQELAAALKDVPEDRREAVLLHHVWGFSFREIGEMLGISERAAKLRSFRGIQGLRTSIKTEGAS